MKDSVTLTMQEQKRLLVLNRMERGEMTAADAAGVLEVSVRQVRRLVATYRTDGASALAHGNRGRTLRHATATAVRQQVLTVASTTYADTNDQHLRDLLEEREGIALSRATVRRILLDAGRSSPRQCRRRVHRRRRERRAQEGALVQIDGSPHDWLEGRGPRLTLRAAIDDATGKILAAVFRLQEDAHGYMLLMRQLVVAHGCPLEIYHDRHGIFQVNTPRAETVAEQRAGAREPTQCGRVLRELGITAIAARSPQAKGRVERLFGTLQERLRIAVRLAEAGILEAANALLPTFIPAHNARFAVPAAEPCPVWRPFVPHTRLDEVICFTYARTVAADNTVQFAGRTLQLLPDRTRVSDTHAHVAVHERLDGSLAVYYQGRCLATQEAPAAAPILRARRRSALSGEPPPEELRPTIPTPEPALPAALGAGPRHPAATHPWRRPFAPQPETAVGGTP
jgi:transposase